MAVRTSEAVSSEQSTQSSPMRWCQGSTSADAYQKKAKRTLKPFKKSWSLTSFLRSMAQQTSADSMPASTKFFEKKRKTTQDCHYKRGCHLYLTIELESSCLIVHRIYVLSERQIIPLHSFSQTWLFYKLFSSFKIVRAIKDISR